MFAKAAALWSNTSLKGGVYLDSTDASYIHCRYAMLKLNELVRVLQMLENTAAQPSSNKTIIPLMNYVIALCQGPLFNVSLVLRRRLHLFSQLRLAKLTEVPAANVTAALELANILPRVETDTKVFIKKFYDRGLQLQVLEGLMETTQNCLAIYSKRMRHILNERDSYRHNNVRERPITSDEAPVEDFISPSEITLALDFAVLITNLQDDTSEVAYRKLTIQVLGKYRDYLNEGIYPSIYNYGLELERLAKTKPANYSLGMARLPFWSHTLHRMFAMLLKIKYLLDISQSVLRQAYMTNRNYLITPLAQMLSSNAYQYQSMLDTLDDVCSVDTVLSDTVTQSVEQYLTQGNKFQVTPLQVVDTYKNQVRSGVTYLGDIIRLIDELHDSWQFILESDNGKFASISEEELENMLDEKFKHDRLIYLGEEPAGATNELSDLESETGSIHTSTNDDSETDYSVVNAKTVSPHGNVGQLVQYLAMQSPSNLLKSASYALHAPTPPHVIAEFSSQRSPKLPNYPKELEEKVSPRWIKGERPYYPRNQWSATSPHHSSSSNPQRRRSNSVQLSNTPTITHSRPVRSHSLQSNSLLNKKLLQNSAKVAMSTYEARGQPSRYYSTPPPTPSAHSPSFTEGPQKIDFSTILRFNVKNQTNRLAALSLDEAIIDPSVTESPSDNRPLSSAICSVNSAASDDATLNSSTLPGPAFRHYSAGNGKKGGIIKKVRFAGVPPPSPSEDPKPKRRGWYKKPAVLHYPPPPPQSTINTNKMRQEGFVFRTNLRCAGMQGTNKHRILDIVKPSGAKTTQKLTTRIRNRLVR